MSSRAGLVFDRAIQRWTAECRMDGCRRGDAPLIFAVETTEAEAYRLLREHRRTVHGVHPR